MRADQPCFAALQAATCGLAASKTAQLPFAIFATLTLWAATGLQAPHAYTLARNSFEASFIDPSAKRRYINMLDACFETFV